MLQVDLALRRAQEVGAANDVGDALLGIVDDDGELVGEEPIAALDQEVADVPGERLSAGALEPVDEADSCVINYGPPREPRARPTARGHAGAAGSRVDALAACRKRGGQEFAPRAGARIDVTLGDEPVERTLVEPFAPIGALPDRPR